MQILENYDLAKHTTFGVRAQARYFAYLNEVSDFLEVLKTEIYKKEQVYFLGGGSNVLFVGDFNGLVLLNNIKGIQILSKDEDSILVSAGSGEDWSSFVEYTTKEGWWGLENLASIPGTVGGAPIQNIGAYGAEVKDTIYEIEAYDTKTGERKVFNNEECCFGYRDSIFKNQAKNKYFISKVVFKLSIVPKVNISYKALVDYLDLNKVKISSPEDVSKAVSSIRKSKLPDPAILGSAGSFFKNVYVSENILNTLRSSYPDIPYFLEEGSLKIPTGWLIEHSGPKEGVSWKGYKIGDAGVHDKQALVLVNHGQATGEDVYSLAKQIMDNVKSVFDIDLVPEVNIVKSVG